VVAVVNNGITSNPQTIAVSPFAPSIFTINSQGTGQGAINADSNGNLVAAVGSVPGRVCQPATAGQAIDIFATGLGAVQSVSVADGYAATGTSPAVTTPTVTIGGLAATVLYSGFAPGFVGLYQVNVKVPTGVTGGNLVPVVISFNGVVSNTATMAIQ
jgi:uncharacterized protein (TIGR03437 family)